MFSQKVLNPRLIKSVFPMRRLAFQRFQHFSNEPSESQAKIFAEKEEFNTYRGFAKEVAEEQLNPEQETKWQRPDDRNTIKERSKLDLLRRENFLVLLCVSGYFLLEDVFSFLGFKIDQPQPTLTDLMWRDKEEELAE